MTAARRRAEAEDRLIKTVLLAALIPDAAPLRGLTVSRLVALNHGTIASPIPGDEGSTALAALKRLRGSVGQLKIQEGVTDPTVSIELSGIDTERIISAAKGELDNPGARRRYVRDFIREQLKLPASEALFTQLRREWRGVDRDVEIAVQNIRELSGEMAVATGEQWRVILDYPFDSEGSGRADDLARIESLGEGIERSQTVFWLPGTFTHRVQTDLGLLVTIEGLLAGERLNQHAGHLAASDREKARLLLESQRTELRSTIQVALNQAYGVAPAKPDVIEEAGEGEVAVLRTLEPAFDVRAPVGADLDTAMSALMDQMLRQQFPKHPEFGERITTTKLNKTWKLVESALGDPDRRLAELEKSERTLLKNIAEPLELGVMHEGPFVVSDVWRERLRRAMGAHQTSEPSVHQLRVWIDEPDPRGLTLPLAQLVILAFAVRENLSFHLHGAPVSVASPTDVGDELDLVQVALPSDEVWKAAADRAAALFGITVSPLPSAQSLDRLGADLQERATAAEAELGSLLASLDGTLLPTLGLKAETDRVMSAREARELMQKLSVGSAADVVTDLAAATLSATPQDLGRTLTSAARVSAAISGANWNLLKAARDLAENGSDEARAALAPLLEAAADSEIVRPLPDALAAAENAATAVVVERKPPPLPSGDRSYIKVSVLKAREVLDEIEDPESVRVDVTVHDEADNNENS